MSDTQSVSSGAEGVYDHSVGGSLSTSLGSESLQKEGPPESDKTNFQATVEDCPEEDGVPLGTPRPAPASTSPTELTPAAPIQAKPTATSPPEQPSVSQEHSMPEFIQIRGPSQIQPREHRPEPLRYLAPGSPVVTKEAIQRSVSDSTYMAQPAPTSPSTLSHRSSVPSSHGSDIFSQGGHRNNNSHDGSSWGSDFGDNASHVSHRQSDFPNQYPPQQPGQSNGYPQQQSWPGSPQMPYGHTHASPFPAYAMADPFQGSPISPQAQPQWQQGPPMSGYELLAARLTGDVWSVPKVTPIYRRFGALNHRLLLQLQDEIVALEQDLCDMDKADAHARMSPHGPYPASRRGELASHSEFAARKHKLWEQIGWRLEAYYKLLESFRGLQFFSCPSTNEVDEYRELLRREQLIHESETRFLDRDNDLITLTAAEYEESHHDTKAGPSRKGDATPTPQSLSAYNSPQLQKAAVAPKPPMFRRPVPRQRPPTDFAYAALGAVAAPLLSFAVVSGFAERMVVVGIVFAFATALVAQSNLLSPGPERLGLTECTVCGAVYVGFMGVVAWSFS